MDSSPPENLSADRKKAIKELIQGRELANQLRVVLGKPSGGDLGESVAAAGDLVAKILGSFTETISILNRRAPSDDELSVQIPANTRVSSPCWDGPKSEDSEGSSKTPALKDRRGCYKRRKTSQTWTRTTPNLFDDGHAWRKYGQKVILNTKHPRNYFRCTHKFDQECQATKQVQRTEEDPPMYRTTYHGHHTCKNLLKAPQIILDSNPTAGDHDNNSSSVLLSFAFGGGSTTPNSSGGGGGGNLNNKQQPQQHEPFFPAAALPLIKQEYQPQTCLEQQNNQSSSSDHYLMSPDHGDGLSSEVYSCSASPHSRHHHHSLDMDLMLGNLDSVNFEDVLQFEF